MKLYDYTEEKLSKMAKRKYRWLGEPIATKMNQIRDEIMQIFDAYYVTDASRKDRCAKAIRDLLSLQKPLLALWNVEHYKTDRMIKWALRDSGWRDNTCSFLTMRRSRSSNA